MLWFWPVFSVLLFATRPAREALLWTVLGAYLLLPPAVIIQVPGAPDLDKNGMSAIGLIIGGWLLARPSARPGDFGLYAFLTAMHLLLPFAIAMANPDPLVGPGLFIKGMSAYDALSMMASNLLVIVPFWAARRFLGDEIGHRRLVVGMLVAMLAYSLPILLEIRLSPQLNTWIYGFFPHNFAQQIRDGGFRAVVFIGHGLMVALWLGLAFVAALAVRRGQATLYGIPCGLIALYLGAVMLLQKSLGALVLAIVFGAVVLASRPRRQIGLAAIVGISLIVYPMLRAAHLVPLDLISSASSSISNDRSASFQFRVDNEERLLAKAQQRPLLGWGNWGRNRIYSAETGKDISVTDGAWVIVLGNTGWFGYLTLFGLFTLPMIRLWRAARRKAIVLSPYTSGLAVMLAINLLDMIPNSSITPLTMLMAGALSGGVRRAPEPNPEKAAEPVEAEDPPVPVPAG